MATEIGPRVTIELPYERALRLAYMAQFPKPTRDGDQEVADVVLAAVGRAERGLQTGREGGTESG